MSQPTSATHVAPIAQFKQKLGTLTKTAACGREFVLVQELMDWLGEPGVPRIAPLLNDAYKCDFNWAPVRPDRISESEQTLLVFCILLDLGYGYLIDKFLEKDMKLSVETDMEAHITEHLQSEGIEHGQAAEIGKRFEEARWRFCPAQFEFGVSHNYGKKRILPFLKRVPIDEGEGKGGTANLWNISVPEEFVGCKLRRKVPSSKFRDEDSGVVCYEFALKTFKPGSEKQYETEKEAFMPVRDHQGMVKYLGHFKYHFHYPMVWNSAGQSIDKVGLTIQTSNEKRTSTQPTNNILLEYGQMDLEVYFANRVPPVLPPEMMAFWRDIFDIAEEVRDIHNLEYLKEKFYGWHADIKPDKILYIRGKFKLADPGFAKWLKKTEQTCARPTTTVDGGTDTYGPPERHGAKSRNPVYQTIDSWSLGCVLSLAATWMVLGVQGVLQYTVLRIRALKRARKASPSEPDDPFHDGDDVLPEVRSWHNILRSTKRITDHITSDVLNLVDSRMLIKDPLERIETEELCEELNKILQRAGKELDLQVADIVVDTLQDVDDKAVEKATGKAAERADFTLRRILAADNDTQQDPATHATNLFPSSQHSPRGSKLAQKIHFMKTGGRSELTESRRAPSPPPTDGGQTDEEFNAPSQQGSEETNLHQIFSANQSPRSTNTGVIDHTPDTFEAPLESPTPPAPTYIPFKESKQASYQEPGDIPSMDVFEAKKWLDERKKGFHFPWKKKPHKVLEGFYKNRDLKFMIDNGNTMKRHWPEAENLIEVLMAMAKGIDDNGIDFYSTDERVKVENTNDATRIKRAMKEAEPDLSAGCLPTDMTRAIGWLCDEYLRRLAHDYHYSRKFRYLTIIIITDGSWHARSDQQGVEDKIVGFISESLSFFGKQAERPISIEFVRLGDDPAATVFLQHLDTELAHRNIPDVIDTESSRGNVFKMLLGSKIYDERESYNNTTPIGGTHAFDLDGQSQMQRSQISPAILPTHQHHVTSRSSNWLFPPPSRTDTKASSSTLRPPTTIPNRTKTKPQEPHRHTTAVTGPLRLRNRASASGSSETLFSVFVEHATAASGNSTMPNSYGAVTDSSQQEKDRNDITGENAEEAATVSQQLSTVDSIRPHLGRSLDTPANTTHSQIDPFCVPIESRKPPGEGRENGAEQCQPVETGPIAVIDSNVSLLERGHSVDNPRSTPQGLQLARNKGLLSTSDLQSNAPISEPHILQPPPYVKYCEVQSSESPSIKFWVLESIKVLARSRLLLGLRRIEWTCSCGEHLYGDYDNSDPLAIDNLAAALQQYGKSTQQVATTTLAPDCSQPSNNISLSEVLSASQTTSQVSNSSEDAQHNPNDTPDSSITSQRIQYDGVRIAQLPLVPLFFELCVNTSILNVNIGEIALTKYDYANRQHVPVVQTDGELFAKIHSRYYSIRKKWWLPLLYHPVNIRFVQFHIYEGHRVGIFDNTTEQIPPPGEVHALRYHYYKCPLKPLPPMDHRAFLHFFREQGKHASAKQSLFLNRLPKKVGESILVRDDEENLHLGWGVYIIEGLNWPVISWCMFGILLLSFIVSICCALLMKTQESGFGIGQWLVAVLTAALTALCIQLREL